MTGLGIVASFVLLALCAVLRPHAARCPAGMDLRTGIRADGSYQCWPHPAPRPGMSYADYLDFDGTFGKPERSVQASWVLAGRIYCTGMGRPTVLDYQRVGCQ